MSRFNLLLSVLFTGLLFTMLLNNTRAAETTITTTTTAPAAVVAAPATVTTTAPAAVVATPTAVTTTTTPVVTTTTPVVVQKQEIITAVPAPKEVVTTPEGFINCFTVKSGWMNNVWIPEHRVCQYQNSPSGVVWIEGYWACTGYSAGGNCTSWDWKPGHWESTLTVY